jgi:hypothetical protein
MDLKEISLFGCPAAFGASLSTGDQVTQILHSLNGAVNQLNREKGRRQNGVSDTDRFKNSQGPPPSWKIR